MSTLVFSKLSEGWNAEPNAPCFKVDVIADKVVLRFYLNHQLYRQFSEDDVGKLSFTSCSRWRLGPTNDEGWFTGQCRYSAIALRWGEFYEIIGDDPARDAPADWRRLGPDASSHRHFLFYLRDETFECLAANCVFALDGASSQ